MARDKIFYEKTIEDRPMPGPKPHNPLSITGYRALTEDEIKEINEIKAIAQTVGTMVDNLQTFPDVDGRWLAIARTDLQKGFMSLVRAIAKPESF